MITQFIPPAVVFVLILASGVWLSSAGKPLNGAIFNIHKLIALGGVVLTAVQIARAFHAAEVQAVLILLVILAGVCVLALFATGAFMSIGKLRYGLLRAVHAAAPVPLAVAVGMLVWLLI